MRDSLCSLFPWLRGYARVDLQKDALAGVIVAVMLVPQAMAYAMLAGLPPVMGLYAASLPLMAYAFIGSSRQLAVGPVAIVSLLVADACAGAGDVGDVVQCAAILALLVGGIQVGLGLLRAGFLVNFVSHGVVSGFTSAGAIMIGLSQLRHVLRIDLQGGHSAFSMLLEAASRLQETHCPTLVLGVSACSILILARLRRWRFPVTLPVIAAAIILVWWFDLEARGIKTVGAVPGGLPVWRLPALSAAGIGALLPSALVIVFIGVMESIAVAKWIATRERYRIDPNRELVGLGLANVVAGLFSGFAVTGGFSRTAVNYQAGARSPAATMVTALLVLLTLLLLTPLFTHLPNAVLAAVIMVAVAGLIDLRDGRDLFRLKHVDGWVYVVTFTVTLAAGMDRGLLVGIALSLALFIWRSARPRMAELGRVGETEFRDISRFPEAVREPGVMILRVDASLYFANAGFVDERIRARLANRPDLRWVLLDMSGVNDIDAMAVTTLNSLMEDGKTAGVQFAFSGMKAQIRKVVERAGWHDTLGPHMRYVGLNQALKSLATRENERIPNPGGTG